MAGPCDQMIGLILAAILVAACAPTPPHRPLCRQRPRQPVRRRCLSRRPPCHRLKHPLSGETGRRLDQKLKTRQ